MSGSIHEEKTLPPTVDRKLLRRLLTYAKPYRWVLTAAIGLLLVTTVAELLQPIVIKSAIDNHFSALSRPMRVLNIQEAPQEADADLPASQGATLKTASGTDRESLTRAAVRALENLHLSLKHDSEKTPTSSSIIARYESLKRFFASNDAFSVEGVSFERLMTDEGLKKGELYARIIEVPSSKDTYIIFGGSDIKAASSFNFMRTSEGWDAVAAENPGMRYPAVPLTPDVRSAFSAVDRLPLTFLAVIYFLLILITFLLTYVQTRMLLITGQKILYDIRDHIFRHLQALSIRFFDQNPVGRLVTRVTNDVEALSEMFSTVLSALAKDMFLIVGIMIAMLFLNVKLALASFLVLPLVYVTTLLYRRVARVVFRRVRVKLARINATLSEYLSGMRIIQLFHRENNRMNDFQAVNREHFDASLTELKAQAVFRPLMDLIYSIGLVIILFVGVQDVPRGLLEIGLLYAFIDYMGRFFQPIREITENYTVLQSAMASSERIFELLDTPVEITTPEAAIQPEKLKGEIRFEQVTFGYNENVPVLRGIDLHIRPGETVAIVGATGAGKSSLINLLPRFYDIQEGHLTIDGYDVRTLDLNTLRQNIGIVLQDVFLFAGTILSNIRLHNPNITRDEAILAAKAVGADRFIEKLPQGYDTPVEERGATLSSGERQLIAFARVIAFNPSILILDEATAHIDTETEQLIQKALKRISEHRTTIIIAHRLSTIQHADKIVVLHKGEIQEVGNHETLLKKGGLYASFYQTQFRLKHASRVG
ncbi:MAG: ABC transporter ATP-binding protein [Candidatus Carbobacillus altaicus]|nr:ABC transporter ATP-binding protein [Candidatus Carbobacillus altaicus]